MIIKSGESTSGPKATCVMEDPGYGGSVDGPVHGDMMDPVHADIMNLLGDEQGYRTGDIDDPRGEFSDPLRNREDCWFSDGDGGDGPHYSGDDGDGPRIHVGEGMGG